MHIENADKKLATYVKRAIAREMAKALKEDRVNLDDDRAVAQALYDKTFSSISIAHLMDDARAIVRRGIYAAPPIFLAATAAALILTGAVALGAAEPKSAGARKIREEASSPRAVVVYREAVGARRG